MLMTEKISEPMYGLMDAMKRNKVTQKDLAQLIGVTETTFNHKINRRNDYDFKVNEAMAIAQHLNISVDDFF